MKISREFWRIFEQLRRGGNRHLQLACDECFRHARRLVEQRSAGNEWRTSSSLVGIPRKKPRAPQLVSLRCTALRIAFQGLMQFSGTHCCTACITQREPKSTTTSQRKASPSFWYILHLPHRPSVTSSLSCPPMARPGPRSLLESPAAIA
jgi:hypothetical protein